MASDAFYRERASILIRAALTSRTEAVRRALLALADRFGQLARDAEPDAPPRRADRPGPQIGHTGAG
jgi:hypothetical protein